MLAINIGDNRETVDLIKVGGGDGGGKLHALCCACPAAAAAADVPVPAKEGALHQGSGVG